jgi:hypothetical protein
LIPNTVGAEFLRSGSRQRAANFAQGSEFLTAKQANYVKMLFLSRHSRCGADKAG